MSKWKNIFCLQDTFLRFYARDARDTANPPTYYSFASSMPNIKLTDFQRTQMKRDPMMITQFVHFFILPFMAKQYPQIPAEKLIVTCDAWRSLNNRPFQRWIDPNTDLAQISYNNPFVGHSHFVLPLIAEVNELSWLHYQKNLTAQWQSRGYDVTFFCDMPGGTWEIYVPKFAQDMRVVSLRGQIEMEVYGDKEGETAATVEELEVGKASDESEKSCW